MTTFQLAHPTPTHPSLNIVSASEDSTPQLPDLSSGKGSGSTPSSSSVDESADNDGGDDVWDMVDSLYSRIVPDELKHPQDRGKKLSSDLFDQLDGATFGPDRSTNRVPLVFPQPPGDGYDLLIPHFPELTDALLGPPENRNRAVRTAGEFLGSEPDSCPEAHTILEKISQGIQQDTETKMLGHVTQERFKSLLDSQVSVHLSRFPGLDPKPSPFVYRLNRLALTVFEIGFITRVTLAPVHCSGIIKILWHMKPYLTRCPYVILE